MGIGISYTGADGKRKNFNAGSVEFLKTAMERVSPNRSMRGVEDAIKTQNLFEKSGDNVKLKSGSAVIKDYRGEVCLRGEESDPLVDGKKIYASLNGRKGYFAINEIDPPVHGRMCGKWLNVDVGADAESIDSNSEHEAFSIPLSRTSCKLTPDGELEVYNYYRELKVSCDGRILGITGESEAKIGQFQCSGDGGDYCVLPEFDSDGNLSSLTFGTNKALKDAKKKPLSEVKVIDTYVGCPYGGSNGGQS